jgi:hypothetical protein
LRISSGISRVSGPSQKKCAVKPAEFNPKPDNEILISPHRWKSNPRRISDIEYKYPATNMKKQGFGKCRSALPHTGYFL